MDRDPTTRELMDFLVDFSDAISVQFDAIAKGVKRIYSRFDRVDAALAQHGKRLEGLEFHYGSLDRRVGRIETRLEDVERRLPA